jgi:hypothetical protein
MPARAGVEGAAARRAERRAVVRRRVEFMAVVGRSIGDDEAREKAEKREEKAC